MIDPKTLEHIDEIMKDIKDNFEYIKVNFHKMDEKMLYKIDELVFDTEFLKELLK